MSTLQPLAHAMAAAGSVQTAIHMTPGHPLNPVERKNFNELSASLSALHASQPDCPADINLDGVVNPFDVDQWELFSGLTMDSSWADIN